MLSCLLRIGWHALPAPSQLPALCGLASVTRTVSSCAASSSAAADDHGDQARFESIMQGLPGVSSLPSAEVPNQANAPQSKDLAATRPKIQTLRSDQEEDPHLALLSDDYGYAVLGGVDPEDTSSDWGLGTPRVHPQRLFNPGETYTAEDFNPFHKAPGAQKQTSQRKNVVRWDKQEVYAQADYKNVPFLEQFVSDAGRLLPRKKTKLQAALHKHVMRQVKIARVMALMPHETRIGDDQRKRLRQFEMLQAQQRSALQSDAAPAPSEPAV